MKILMASSEAVPYIKTGGLADVAGTLLKELRSKNEKASLVLPLYAAIKNKYKLHATGKAILVKMGDVTYRGSIFASSKEDNPEAYFIECDELYGRTELYGTSAGDYPDNAIRFIFFSRAVLELCLAMRIKPDVIHCNDWQTALIPLYLKTIYKDNTHFAKTATLFTVHNLGYQGIFDAATLLYTGLGREYFTPERLEFYGKLNLMKAGLLYADLINTVSNTYAQEIQQPEYGFGLDGIMKKRAEDLYGVINGIDYGQWDPAMDTLIPSQYGASDLKGKERCRRQLCQEASFHKKTLPVAAIISRLSSQKGVDLVLSSLEALIAAGLNLIVLGKGEAEYERLFKGAAESYKGRIFAHIGFDEKLARLIYAGSDFFLMPSQYEPCGLGQLIAMKYGTVPIARKTGGLADTIQDYDHMTRTGTGFLFSGYSPYALQDAVKRAICVFTDKPNMKKMVADVMKKDFPWSRSTDTYLKLYKRAGKRAKTINSITK
ncbi:MAG: glycogen synthase GlgA [Nitrospira bacterium HGW-Nitrospira-1]|nr:MAG: glycogen synthase GlgA [Nitrospira bacterium HGW-Nitrospira-1]